MKIFAREGVEDNAKIYLKTIRERTVKIWGWSKGMSYFIHYNQKLYEVLVIYFIYILLFYI